VHDLFVVATTAAALAATMPLPDDTVRPHADRTD
jgi:hypothetical protein